MRMISYYTTEMQFPLFSITDKIIHRIQTDALRCLEGSTPEDMQATQITPVPGRHYHE